MLRVRGSLMVAHKEEVAWLLLWGSVVWCQGSR